MKRERKKTPRKKEEGVIYYIKCTQLNVHVVLKYYTLYIYNRAELYMASKKNDYDSIG